MSEKLKKLTFSAMLIAVSVILVYFLHFPIFPAAPFLEYDPADIPILIGAFTYGLPVGLAITVIASAIQALTVSAGSGVYGFIMHVIATMTLVTVSTLIYRPRCTKKSAIIGLLCGTLAMGAAMMAANYFITPLFMFPADMYADGQREIGSMLMSVFLPFNLLKAGINSVVVFLLYNRVGELLGKKK